jgi:hypothetical protein
MSEQGPPAPMMATDPEAVVDAMLQAVLNAANKANTATDSRDIESAATAALKFAQAIVILDPTLDPQGVPLSHHTEIEKMRGQSALEQVREKSAAPSPAKRSGNGSS